MSSTSGSVVVDLNNIRDIINNSTLVGARTTGGIADQGDLIGLAIGLAIALSLLAVAIGVILGLIFIIFAFARRLKSQTI